MRTASVSHWSSTTPEAPLFANRYRLLKRIGKGGQGEVYLALEELPGQAWQRVAIKRLRRDSDEALRAQFRREASLTRRLDHPNVVPTLASGTSTDGPYLAMEYVDGTDLRDVLARLRRIGGRLPVGEAALIVRDAARGAHYCHTLRDGLGRPLRIVHRDLTPRNVMVTWTGVARILDFGMARDALRDTVTHPDVVKGTPGYVAPEAVLGWPVTPRSDVFLLGVLLYELTTGRAPFEGATPEAAFEAALRKRVDRPSTHVEDVPASLDAIVSRALQRDPADRFESAKAMAEALSALLEEVGDASRTGLGRRLQRLTTSTVSADDFESGASVPRTELFRRDNLAEPPGPLIGRRALLRQVLAHLERGEHVHLSGPVGAGKSRLALEAALERRAAQTDPGGVWRIEARGAHTAEALRAAIANTLDADPVRLAESLSYRGPTLLVVDGLDCEKVHSVAKNTLTPIQTPMPGCAHREGVRPPGVHSVLREILVGAPDVTLLVTGRAVWRCDGVVSVGVGGLTAEPDSEVGLSPALELLFAAVRARMPEWQPVAGDGEALARLASSFDALPLALEELALRLPSASADELLAGTLWTDGGKPGPVGRGVAEMLDSVSAEARDLLAQCTVFHGGFTREAAAAVVDADDLGRGLDELVDASLLRQSGDRLLLWDIVREPARRALAEGPRRQAVFERHRQWCLGRAAALAPAAGRTITTRGMAWVADEASNLLAAQRRALAEQPPTPESATAAVSATVALLPYAIASGSDPVFRQRLEDARAVAEAAGLPDEWQAELLLGEARLRFEEGRIAEAVDAYRLVVDRATKARRKGLEARGRALLAESLAVLGETDGALDEARRALRACEQAGRVDVRARALHAIASARARTGRRDAAIEAVDAALTLFRELDDTLGEARVLSLLGRMHHAAGDLEPAERYLRGAVARLHGHRALRPIAAAYLQLGAVLAERGDLRRALRCYNKAVRRYQRAGDTGGMGRGLLRIALTRDAAADHAAARAAWMRAAPLLEPSPCRADRIALFAVDTLFNARAGRVRAAFHRLDKARALLPATDPAATALIEVAAMSLELDGIRATTGTDRLTRVSQLSIRLVNLQDRSSPSALIAELRLLRDAVRRDLDAIPSLTSMWTVTD